MLIDTAGTFFATHAQIHTSRLLHVLKSYYTWLSQIGIQQTSSEIGTESTPLPALKRFSCGLGFDSKPAQQKKNFNKETKNLLLPYWLPPK